ncbi:hypothetical protein [Lutimonas zeaxanthinifaciens]|uniref:hypothetical protein n=1 Tax=Lutimonas zeaxanthinifaciens TaxID=3060215 RepID=UPI00265D0A59|nr:hypothetical protein [Lutimonas sp. YSD2104]WKK66007.1 hypothetical protein QZH61_15640 [Lutimonas sp. YSD2104]
MKENYSKCWMELSSTELMMVQGGGPIKDAFEWYYKSVGSFYRGIYDGLMGKEPLV